MYLWSLLYFTCLLRAIRPEIHGFILLSFYASANQSVSSQRSVARQSNASQSIGGAPAQPHCLPRLLRLFAGPSPFGASDHRKPWRVMNTIPLPTRLSSRCGSRKWQPPVSAGGLILLPLSLIVDPPLPTLSAANLAGLVWLGLVGAAATYAIWLRGVAKLEPGTVSMLGMMSPVTAVILGWLWLGQALSPLQFLGAAVVLVSVWVGQGGFAARHAIQER
jgi:hypothetical protein